MDPLEVMADRLAVMRWILELKNEAGAGNTEMEAPESTRKCLDKSVSWRLKSEDEDLAGKKNFFPLAA